MAMKITIVRPGQEQVTLDIDGATPIGEIAGGHDTQIRVGGAVVDPNTRVQDAVNDGGQVLATPNYKAGR